MNLLKDTRQMNGMVRQRHEKISKRSLLPRRFVNQVIPVVEEKGME